MRPRTELIDCFSTFAQFDGDRFKTWIVDLHLQKSMQQQTQLTNQSETFWALHWYQQWQQQSHPRSVAHLYAYLQEPCYWAAQKLTQRFVSIHYTLADGFQDAIAHTSHILACYNPHRGSRLKDYARTAFSNYLRNRLHQQKIADICSDWGLLRKLSKTQLTQSLLNAGFAPIDTDLLIWQCFKAACTPTIESALDRTVRTLAPPSATKLSQIAAHYNQLRIQLKPVPPTIESEVVVASLKRSVQAARAYLNPVVTSLDYSYDEGGTALIDRIGVAEDAVPMANMIAAELDFEQQQKRQAIGAVLSEAIAALPLEMQKLLSLYYQDQLTQKDIAAQLNIKQYQVSRQLNRARQQLLLRVAQWSQDTLHISIESAVLASMSEVIHEWLQQHHKPALMPEILSNASTIDVPEALS